MWFTLGFVTLFISVGYQWWLRWHRRWRGVADEVGGIPCETRLREFKGIVYGLSVGLDAPETYRFELKREGSWDRLFKWLGLSAEYQFGHPGFDPLVYVASDDQHLLRTFAGDKALLQAIQHLFAKPNDEIWLKKITCANGYLWMDVGTSDLTGKASQERTRAFAAVLLPLLKQVSKALDASMPDSAPSIRDRHLIPSIAILALSSGLAVNGVVSWTRSWVASSAFIVDAQAFWAIVWALSAVVVSALVIASLFWLRGSSKLHLVLMELLLVGTFGAVSTVGIALKDANIDWDSSPATLIEQSVMGRSVRHSRKRMSFEDTPHYYLTVRHWSDASDSIDVEVSLATYEQATLRGKLQFEQHSGYFALRWAKFKTWLPPNQVADPT
jgi:hypothetical protein